MKICPVRERARERAPIKCNIKWCLLMLFHFGHYIGFKFQQLSPFQLFICLLHNSHTTKRLWKQKMGSHTSFSYAYCNRIVRTQNSWLVCCRQQLIAAARSEQISEYPASLNVTKQNQNADFRYSVACTECICWRREKRKHLRNNVLPTMYMYNPYNGTLNLTTAAAAASSTAALKEKLCIQKTII